VFLASSIGCTLSGKSIEKSKASVMHKIAEVAHLSDKWKKARIVPSLAGSSWHRCRDSDKGKQLNVCVMLGILLLSVIAAVAVHADGVQGVFELHQYASCCGEL
jgi:hypothetical protein